MIKGFVAPQDKGKSLAMVIDAFVLHHHPDFDYKHGFGNIWLNPDIMDGYECLENAALIERLKWLVNGRFKHVYVLIDEIDRVFPARFWSDKEQTKSLLGLWQDYKMFWQIEYTAHGSTPVDKMLFDATRMLVFPAIDKKLDCLDLHIVDGNSMSEYDQRVHNVSLYYPLYNRWQPIK